MFYRPEERDAALLPHDPIKAIVAPRPIGWISTLSRDAIPNLSPYSFFNLIGGAPPVVMFSSEGMKDSARNAIETGEFVHNYVDVRLEAEMNASSLDAPPSIDEFEHVGLEKAPSRLIAPPRVAAALAAFECKTLRSIELEDLRGDKTGAVMVMGQVVGVHVDEAAIADGRFDLALAPPVSRLGYLDFATIGAMRALPRPTPAR